MIYTEEEIQEYLIRIKHDAQCNYYGYEIAAGSPGAFADQSIESELYVKKALNIFYETDDNDADLEELMRELDKDNEQNGGEDFIFKQDSPGTGNCCIA